MGGRRDSSAQAGTSPPSTSPPPNRNRRRSSLAQLTDILREWSGGSKRNKPPLNRRETLADLARSLPWHRISNDQYSSTTTVHAPPLRKRRESSADSGIKSMRSRRDSHTSDVTTKVWTKKDSVIEKENQEIPSITGPCEVTIEPSSTARNGSRRGSGDSASKSMARRDSLTVPPPKVVATHKKRRDSLAAPETPNFRQEQRPSTSSGDSGSLLAPQQADFSTQCIPMPTMMITSVSPPATSPKFELAKTGRRDSTTQCRDIVSRYNRRESRLQRQATTYDEYTPHTSRRNSQSQQPTLSPSGDVESTGNLCDRQARRDSLSPDINSSR